MGSALYRSTDGPKRRERCFFAENEVLGLICIVGVAVEREVLQRHPGSN